LVASSTTPGHLPPRVCGPKRDQVELLTAFGCTQGQGHFFSQPVPANEFAQWLARQDTADTALKAPIAKHRRRGRFQEAIEGFEARPASNG